MSASWISEVRYGASVIKTGLLWEGKPLLIRRA